MLTQEDLGNIKILLDTQQERLEERFDRIEERLGKVEERLGKVEERLDRVEGRLDGVEERLDRVEERLDRVEERLDRVEERLDRVEEHINKVESDLKALSSYTHKKFAWVENDMILKITALFDGRELCVQHVECRRRNEEIQRKLAYIDPLVQKVQEHVERLEYQDEILKRLVNE